MEDLFTLQHNYSGTIFNGILPEEIELYIFKIIWHIKFHKFNFFFLDMFHQLREINLPLTENCSLKESLDLYETPQSLPLLRKSLTKYQNKYLTSPYKWWNTRIPLNFTYKQIYFISEQTHFFDNNWYYKEEYDIVSTRFRVKYLEEKNMKIIEFTNNRNNTKYIKTFKKYDLNNEDWKNRGVNNPIFSIYPNTFRDKKIIYYYDLDEAFPLNYDNICYYQK